MKFSNCGFIMTTPSYIEGQKTKLKANGFTTTTSCVQDIDVACISVKK